MDKTIYTIGHSTYSFNKLYEMLISFNIELLVDVRRFPGSRKHPQFGTEALKDSLNSKGCSYLHLEALGGRRKVNPNSKNSTWRNTSFRAYADYMETPEFESAVQQLQTLAHLKNVAYMCSESLWWRCHRSLISDYLKVQKWQVLHIMDTGKANPHRFTPPAITKDNKLSYHNNTLFE